MSPEQDNPKNRAIEEEMVPGMPVRGLSASMVSLSSTRTPAAHRVSPAALQNALRRRGFVVMGVFGLTLATSLALPSPLNSLLCIGVLGGLFFQPRPLRFLQKWLRQRCQACDTPLESLHRETETDDASGACVTRCPACEVEV